MIAVSVYLLTREGGREL